MELDFDLALHYICRYNVSGYETLIFSNKIFTPGSLTEFRKIVSSSLNKQEINGIKELGQLWGKCLGMLSIEILSKEWRHLGSC